MTNIVVALLVLGSVALAVLLVFVVRRWRSEELVREEQRDKTATEKDRQAKSRLKDLVAAGTHVEDGRERCCLKPCPHPASEHEFHFSRDDHSFDAWVRRRFGAQPRLRIVPGARRRYCVPHAALLHARFVHRAANHEAARASFLAREDGDLAEFEHTVDEAVALELAAKRDAASIPPPASKAPPVTTTSISSSYRKQP